MWDNIRSIIAVSLILSNVLLKYWFRNLRSVSDRWEHISMEKVNPTYVDLPEEIGKSTKLAWFPLWWLRLEKDGDRKGAILLYSKIGHKPARFDNRHIRMSITGLFSFRLVLLLLQYNWGSSYRHSDSRYYGHLTA